MNSMLGGVYVEYAQGDQPSGTSFGTLFKMINPNKVSVRIFLDHVNNKVFFKATDTNGQTLMDWKSVVLS